MTVRLIEVRERVMQHNDVLAEDVRRRLDDADVFALNLVSSPGAGKTLLRPRRRAHRASCRRSAAR